jgi:methionyl-tRNA formyltransferase
MLRVIFMGTPSIAVPTLERIASDGHQIVGVFTQPDRPAGRGNRVAPPPIKECAAERGLPIFQPTKIKTPETHELFAGLNADVAVIVAYGRILPQHLLDAPKFGCLNVHFSLLPKYRGAAPLNWAVANDEPVTGVTVMHMDAGLDTGDIATQTECWIAREDDAVTLGERMSRIGADALSDALKRLETGTLPRQSQDHALASYAPILKREDGLIHWNDRAEAIAARIRGFQPWPGCHTTLGEARVIIWRGRTGKPTGFPAAEPGTVVETTSEAVVVACGDGTSLNAEELQMEGRKRMSARDFANGMRLSPGVRFVSMGLEPNSTERSSVS